MCKCFRIKFMLPKYISQYIFYQWIFFTLLDHFVNYIWNTIPAKWPFLAVLQTYVRTCINNISRNTFHILLVQFPDEYCDFNCFKWGIMAGLFAEIFPFKYRQRNKSTTIRPNEFFSVANDYVDFNPVLAWMHSNRKSVIVPFVFRIFIKTF